MSNKTPAITLAGVSKRFGKRVIFENLNLEIPANSITCVVGPSGVGKTCMLRIIAGIDANFEGKVLISGKDVTSAGPAQRRLAFLFQHPVLYPYLSVYDNIRFPLQMKKTSTSIAARQVDLISTRLQINHLLSRSPDTLSGGERQRVALARAFITGANLILLDEPLKASFEPALKSELRGQIRELHNEIPGTIVLITHDQEEGLELGNFLIILLPDHPPILIEKRAAYMTPPSLSIAKFIGGGTVLSARYDEQRNSLIMNGTLALPLNGHLPYRYRHGVKWIIRPEGIDLIPGGTFKIMETAYQGPRSRLKLSIIKDTPYPMSQDFLLDAFIDSPSNIGPGELTDLAIDSGRILGFDESEKICSV